MRLLRRKKTRASRRTRARRMQTYPRPRTARKLPTHLQVIVGARAKSRFRKLIGIIGTRFTRRRRSDNWINGAGIVVVRCGQPPQSITSFFYAGGRSLLVWH